MKIYTRQGDDGLTGLFGGDRVSKGAARVEAYGTVDELNAHLGWAICLLHHLPVQGDLAEIQSDLFCLGADLAVSPNADPALASRSVTLPPDRADRLERLIDRLDSELPPLRQFILPGGSTAACALQISRAVCRRAERCIVRLAAEEPVNAAVIVYLNRLSDLLFVLARWTNLQEGISEPTWSPKPAG